MKKKSFSDLLDLVDNLLGPRGCPWDKKQTIESLQPFLLEEMHELLEAIDNKDFSHVIEEAGDVFFQIIFIAKIAEKKNLFTIHDIITCLFEKMIRRHPHVFGKEKVETEQKIWENWNKIKKEEGKIGTIPKTLPSLLRAEKLLKKYAKEKPSFIERREKFTEEEIAQQLWDIMLNSSASGVDSEAAFRRFLLQKEKELLKKHAEDVSMT